MKSKRSKKSKRSNRFKTPPSGIETLERLKRWPGLKRRVMEEAVMIWSGEHRAFWREGGRGYVDKNGIANNIAKAWVLPLDDAIKNTQHCGPEKRIEFHSLF